MSVRTQLLLSILVACLASMGVLSPVDTTAQAGPTVQDFTADFPPPPPAPFRRVQAFRNQPGAVITPGGWDGNFLRLTNYISDNHNSVAYGEVVSDPYDLLEIDLEFRIGTGDSTGDGLGVAYLNSANFGSTTLDGTPDDLEEEVNLAGTFGVGFDTFNNDDRDVPVASGSQPNSVSLHYDGARLAVVDLSSTVIPLLETGADMSASIIVEPDGGGNSFVSLSISDGVNTIDPFDGFFVAGLAPYAGRLAIAGRTGGANHSMDIDNVVLTHTPVGGSPNEVLRDGFDTPIEPWLSVPAPAGGTPFSVGHFGSDPEPMIVPESKAEGEGMMRLSHGFSRTKNSVAFDKTSGNTAVIVAEFDFRIVGNQGGLRPASDGGAFLLLPTDTYGDSGPLSFGGDAEEPNLAGALGVGFDTFEGDGEDAPLFPPGAIPETGSGGTPDDFGNHLSLHFDGAFLGKVALNPYVPEGTDIVNGVFNHVTVEVVEIAELGGSEVTVSIEDGTDGSVQVPFDAVFIPGLKASSSQRAAFTWRSGGGKAFFDLDNVNVQFIPEPSTLSLLGFGLAGVIVLMLRRRRP